MMGWLRLSCGFVDVDNSLWLPAARRACLLMLRPVMIANVATPYWWLDVWQIYIFSRTIAARRFGQTDRHAYKTLVLIANCLHSACIGSASSVSRRCIACVA